MSPLAAAETCAFDQAGWTSVANDASLPADDVVLLSIGLDAAGEFKVRSAKRTNGVADYAWQLGAMAAELTPHQTPADATTPFDMALDRDTVIVFRLEPGAWVWESEFAKTIFLKDTRADGRAQPHNPFTVAANSTAGRAISRCGSMRRRRSRAAPMTTILASS